MNDKRKNTNLNNNNVNNSAPNVHSFGVQNDTDRLEKESLRERIETSKKNNLDNNTKRTSKDIEGEIKPESQSSLPKEDALTSDKKSAKDMINPKNLAKSAAGSIGRNALNKAKESDSLTGDVANAVDKGIKTAENIKKAQLLLKFLATPIGHIALIAFLSLIGLIVVILIAAVLSDPFQLWISSISMKFGLSGEYSYDATTSVDEQYDYIYNNEPLVLEEGMTRREIEDIIANATDEDGNKIECKLGFFAKIRLFLGFPDLSDPCEYMQYFKKKLEEYEKKPGVNTIAPGYIMNTFYYAFETQNYKDNGEPFITSYIDNDAEINDKKDEEERDVTSDLDAINLLFGHKRANGSRLFTRADIIELIEEYLYHDNHYYWKYIKVQDDPEIWECRRYITNSYKVDVDKYKLFLRYGYDVSVGYNTISKMNEKDGSRMPLFGNRGYQADININNSYLETDDECKEEFTKFYGELPPGLDVYKTKAYPDVEGDDGAEFTLANGKTYNYSTGYIFKRYPRYLEEFTTTQSVDFDYGTAKEIEKFIEHISDRQDYGNYLLGYESDVGKLIGKRGNGKTGSLIVDCDYSELENNENNGSSNDSLGTVDSSGMKVELMYPSGIKFDAFEYTPNTSMGMDLIDVEKYALGTVFAEAGDTPWQSTQFITNSEATSKAFAVMVRSFLLANGVKTKTDGQSVIQIANSTARQTYCDPDNGCYRCYDASNPNNIIMLPADSELAKNNSQCNKVEPLPANSALRQYVKETIGQVLVNSNGQVASAQYDNVKLAKWLINGNPDSSLSNLDYIELLQYQYGDLNYTLKSADCDIKYDGYGNVNGTDYVATGPWDSWRQGGNEPWANQPFGAGTTMANAGCLITAYAKLLADSGGNLLISNFNPGNFVQSLNANDCFEKNDLRNDCALRTAVGAGHYSYSADSLSGSFENKRAFITSKLNEGYQVIISVKNDGHWVYVTGTTSDDILMSDPAGRGTSVRDTYGNTSTSYKLIKIF